MKKIKITLLISLISFCFYAEAQVKVACIGNSITFGSGIENREVYSYPAQLQLILGKEWEVGNFGVSGRTMLKKGNQPLWNEAKFAEALAYKPDIVIIKLGTNDSKDFNWKFKDEFLVDYQAMIDTFRIVSNPIIYVCQPVPAFEKRWSIDSLVVAEEVVPMVEKIGKENNLTVINLFDPFLDKELLFPDKIHPNGHGAALMAGIISKYLLKDYSKILERHLGKMKKE